MKPSGRDRGALTGALFVVLVLVAFAGLGGDTPDGDEGAPKVVKFFTDHENRQIFAAVVLALSTVPLVFFAATLRERFAAALGGRSSPLLLFMFGSGVVAAAGFLMGAGVHFTLADYANDIDPVAVQAINAIDNDTFLGFTTGLAGMVLGASLLSLRTRLLPAAMAWLGIVLFVAFFTPGGFIALMVTAIWIVVASVLLYRSGEAAVAPAS